MKKIILLFICLHSLCFSQAKFEYYPKAKLEKDLDFFFEKVTNIHPLMVDKSFCNNWKNKISSIKTNLKDSLSQNEFYLLLAPLLAELNDAHSNFLCPSEQRKKYMMSGGLSFPFAVNIINNSILISEYYGNDSTLFIGGEEILQINNIPAENILIEMRKLFGGTSVALKNETLEYYFRNYLWMLFSFEKDYKLTIKTKNNAVKEIKVAGINNDEFIRNRTRYSSKMQAQYQLKFADSNTAVFKIKTFADLDGFCSIADSVFRELKNSKTKNLIIDIRGNMGGRSIVVDSLMNYLTDKPYSIYKSVETRISKELLEYYNKKYPKYYEILKNEQIDKIVIDSAENYLPAAKTNRFVGNLYLLTDNLTFSGAANFAGVFKELKLGKIIGEETGGTIAFYGDFWFQTLPTSGLQFHISPKRFIQYGGDDFTRGVLPDYSINLSSEELPDNEDIAIDFTLELINK